MVRASGGGIFSARRLARLLPTVTRLLAAAPTKSVTESAGRGNFGLLNSEGLPLPTTLGARAPAPLDPERPVTLREKTNAHDVASRTREAIGALCTGVGAPRAPAGWRSCAFRKGGLPGGPNRRDASAARAAEWGGATSTIGEAGGARETRQ